MDVERAQAERMIFAQDAATLGAADHTDAQRHQPLHRGAGAARTTTQPQQRTTRPGQGCGQRIQCRRIRLCAGQGQRRQIVWQVNQHLLHVDRYFQSHRSGRCAHGIAYRSPQHAQRALCIPDAPGRFAQRFHHRHLVACFMDIGQIAIEIGQLDLPGDVQ